MQNTLSNQLLNNPTPITVMSEKDNNDFVFNLIGEIHTNYGFIRSKL